MFAGTLLVSGTYCLNAGLVAILPWVDAGSFNVLSREDSAATGLVDFDIECSLSRADG